MYTVVVVSSYGWTRSTIEAKASWGLMFVCLVVGGRRWGARRLRYREGVGGHSEVVRTVGSTQREVIGNIARGCSKAHVQDKALVCRYRVNVRSGLRGGTEVPGLTNPIHKSYRE